MTPKRKEEARKQAESQFPDGALMALYARELLAALDERDRQLAECQSREGTTGGVYRELYSAREVVEAPRRISREAWETLRDLMGPSHPHTVACRDLRDAIERHDEAAK